MATRGKTPKLTLPSDDKPYEIGFGKPPEATRFKPGRSGNPRGRPKGARNKSPALNEERFKDIVLAEAYRVIKINEGDKKISISMAKAVFRSLAVNAAKGQQRAQKLFAELLSTTEQSNKALHDEYLKTMIEYKVDWEHELERRKMLGIVAPDPVPHPDDIIIDMNTGLAHIHGPMTKEEKVVWNKLRKRLDDSKQEIKEIKKMLADPESSSYRDIVEQDLAFETRIHDRLTAAIGDWPNRR